MPEASELQVILSVAEQLGEELGGVAPKGNREDRVFATPEQPPSWGPIDDKNAQLVVRLREALARIATAVRQPEEEADKRVAAALARTELVIRGELLRGDEAALRKQLPGFVFLVVLPGAGMDRAVEVAKRAADLLEEAPG